MWLPYDPKNPPKIGQLVRYRYYSELLWQEGRVSSTGFLYLGCVDPYDREWEIWREDEPCHNTLPKSVLSERDREIAFFRKVDMGCCICGIKQEMCFYHKELPNANRT